MKKFFAILMTLALMLSLAVPAVAEGEIGSITIKSNDTVSVANKTFYAYKILDLKMVGDSGYVYTVPTAMQTFYNSRYNLNGTEANYDYLVTDAINKETDMFAFATDALTAAKDAGVTPSSASAGTSESSVTISGLALGYYVIEDKGTATPISALMLDSTDPTAEVTIKADKPTIDKSDDDESVEVGQTVNYTVTSKVPDTTGYTTYTFKITDAMSEGLTFNIGSIKVSVDDTKLTENYSVVSESASGFILTIDVMKLQANAGKTITVTYNATVNEHAICVVENNSVTLEYSNNPNSSSSTEITPPDQETVYSAKIVIDKYDAKDQNVKLEGAQFVLKHSNEKYYKWDDTNKKVTWVDTQSDATVVITDANGAATFNGLEDGTYSLIEIKAPAGYNLLQGPVSVVINGLDAEGKIVVSQLTVTQPIANNSGTELPETGGMGTTIFYTVGGVMVVAAVVLLITKKRMSAEG